MQDLDTSGDTGVMQRCWWRRLKFNFHLFHIHSAAQVNNECVIMLHRGPWGPDQGCFTRVLKLKSSWLHTIDGLTVVSPAVTVCSTSGCAVFPGSWRCCSGLTFVLLCVSNSSDHYDNRILQIRKAGGLRWCYNPSPKLKTAERGLVINFEPYQPELLVLLAVHKRTVSTLFIGRINGLLW